MVRCQITSSAHTCFLLFALLGLLSNLTDSSPINPPDRQSVSDHNDPLYSSSSSSLLLSRPSLPTLGAEEDKRALSNRAEEGEEEEDELFKDVDPKTLAAVLLEALNKPQEERNREGGGAGEEEAGAAGKNVEEKGQEVQREAGGGEEEEEEEDEEEESMRQELRDLQQQEAVDRGRDGQAELERAVAAAMAQGREERQREEEEERRKKAEEEERLTEKVTSRTTSQTVPMKTKTEADEGQKEEAVKYGENPAGEGEEEEEEQLSPEEVKNLQSMMEKFQSISPAAAEGQDTAEKIGQRGSRGDVDDFDIDYPDNDIRPKGFRGYKLGLSKKKLKWKQQQEEQQDQPKPKPKPKTRPTYKGGNFMDDFNDNDRSEEEEEQEEEEVISPEEEEARAKAEQEEVRRQAAEAQRAKAEEEKLADIASDMLLQYMMKQDGRKSLAQRKNNAFGMMNAAEDKRSEEEMEEMEDDDIDPQTIDKLIEISSKLHLPADDVVDIISDVEKKKKDAPEILTRQRPLMPLPAPAAEAPAPRFPTTTVKQLPPPISGPFKSWFKDRATVKPSKQDFWLKTQRQPFRAYSPYPFYQKTYPGYYPIYFPPPKPKPRYYAKPAYAFNPLLGNSLDYDFDFSPKRRYRAWSNPRLRTPPALQRNPYFPNYIMPHPRSYAAVPMPKPRSAVPPRHQQAFFYPPPAPLVTRAQDYYSPRRPPADQDSEEELENFIEKVFRKHPRMFQ
ncbi:ABC transporter F family member 4 [Engraulis encrasicolus]|uniref:ABC transporter F family member 4 n=1 Tax=Engraulis encrasicolus TaxID=184585 RepID=UPI002FD48B0E